MRNGQNFLGVRASRAAISRLLLAGWSVVATCQQHFCRLVLPIEVSGIRPEKTRNRSARARHGYQHTAFGGRLRAGELPARAHSLCPQHPHSHPHHTHHPRRPKQHSRA
jgi:hypothetical protein